MRRWLMLLMTGGVMLCVGAACGGDDPHGTAPPESVDGGQDVSSDELGDDGSTGAPGSSTATSTGPSTEPPVPECTDRECSWPDERERTDDEGCRTCVATRGVGEECRVDTDCHHQHFCNEGTCDLIVGQSCETTDDCPDSSWCGGEEFCLIECAAGFRCAGGFGCGISRNFDTIAVCMPDSLCELSQFRCTFED